MIFLMVRYRKRREQPKNNDLYENCLFKATDKIFYEVMHNGDDESMIENIYKAIKDFHIEKKHINRWGNNE